MTLAVLMSTSEEVQTSGRSAQEMIRSHKGRATMVTGTVTLEWARGGIPSEVCASVDTLRSGFFMELNQFGQLASPQAGGDWA